MVRKLDPRDFRAHRKVLDPSDFALGDDDPDPPPTDLVREEVWDGIMTLASDVAIRTTSYQGERIDLLYKLWAGWISVVPQRGMVADAMLDAADEFAAALFNLVHGFYKQSIASLRNAFEAMSIACECELSGASDRWAAWNEGEEFKFQDTSRRLVDQPALSALERQVRQSTGASIFPDSNDRNGKAWARNLYKRLSQFSHARGNSTNGSLWHSNGPIYSAEGMQAAYYAYLETYALLVILTSIAADQFRVPPEAHILYEPDSLKTYLVEPFPSVCAYYASEVLRPTR